jgi:chaperonin GroES
MASQPASRPAKLRTVKPRKAAPRSRPADVGPEHIRLTGDRLLVTVPDDGERRSKGGLLIPATAASPARRCVWSEVILVGPESRNVRVGDRVLFLPHTGLEMEARGETYLLLRERDVQAIESSHGDHPSGQYL